MLQPIIIPIALSDEQRAALGIRNKEAYRLEVDYEYQWTCPAPTQFHDAIRLKIFIPKGLIYDGASVPRAAWTLSGILPDGLIRAAALVHDFLYMHGGVMPKGSVLVLQGKTWVPIPEADFTRLEADQAFLQIMEEAGVSKAKRLAAFTAVRLFGFTGWDGRSGKRLSMPGPEIVWEERGLVE